MACYEPIQKSCQQIFCALQKKDATTLLPRGGVVENLVPMLARKAKQAYCLLLVQQAGGWDERRNTTIQGREG
jgi:hypothetical protein